MCESIKITIIITVYNKEESLYKCLSSLLKQDTDKFEIIVVDDGSSDNSLSICKNVLKNRVYSKIINQQHGGVSAARNKGLQLAKTDYIMFLDSDDWLEKDTISKLLYTIENQKLDLIVFGFYRELEYGKSYPVCSNNELLLDTKNIREHFTSLWSSGLFYSVCNKLFYLPMIKENNLLFHEINFGEDFEFSRNVLKICESVKVIKDCFYHYTSHIDGSLSSIYREDLFSIRVNEHRDMIKYFKDMNCYDENAQEFLARRHIERVVGCIENICSPKNNELLNVKIKQIKEVINDKNTYDCAIKAKINGKKMKLLIKPIIKKQYIICLIFGYIMSFCKHYIPSLFINLKMNR